MCLLLPVNSVFIIKDNIIPKELRQDRNCKGGLVLSKTKPDEYVPISCANIRSQQTDKQDFVFRDFQGSKNEATVSPTEYIAEYDGGICKMKAVELQDTYNGTEYDKIHSEGNIPSLLNSYGYCKEDETFTRHNRDVPFKIVYATSCENYGYRSSYSENECSVYSRIHVSDTQTFPGDIMTHDDKFSSFDKPWGCVYVDGTVKLNVYDADDIELGAENKSYSDRNIFYYDTEYGFHYLEIIRNLGSGYNSYSEMQYIHKSIFLGLNEYARPTESPQLLNMKAKYTNFINSVPPIYRAYPYTGREDDWRIEYNEIYFTAKFHIHYKNLTKVWGAKYYIDELDYRLYLQLMKDNEEYIYKLKEADSKMRVMYSFMLNYLNTIENHEKSFEHVAAWLDYTGFMPTVPGSIDPGSIDLEIKRFKQMLADAADLVISNGIRIKEIIDTLDFANAKSKLEATKNAARETLYEAYVDLSNERYKPIDLNKRALHYPDEVRQVFGKVINGVVQIPEDYESDPRYIRYENAFNSDWKDTYGRLNVRLFEDPIRLRYALDINGVNMEGLIFDNIVDNALQEYEIFYTTRDVSFDTEEPLPVYKYVPHRGLSVFHPTTVGEPEVTSDRFETRINIQNEMVNVEHAMIQGGSMDLTALLSLHRQLISQPPLCTDTHQCLCYETYTDKSKALEDCAEKCPDAFRHFWDQSDPRLTSKILVHDRSECVCMEEALTEVKCVLRGRQWINELFVSQYDMVPPMDSVRRDTQYEDTYLYCKMMDCVHGTVNEPCLYSGGVCEKGWFDGDCNAVDACDGFVYEDCMCGLSICTPGKYCTQSGVCKNIVPKDDKKLLYLYSISRI
jgi:hypothetical protein